MTTSKLPSLIGMRSISKDGIFSIEARDMDMKLLSTPESNNTLAKCWHDKQLSLVVDLDSSGGIVFRQFLFKCYLGCKWSSSISSNSFLPSVLLWLVVIIAVVGVGVTVVVIIAGIVVVESSPSSNFSLWSLGTGDFDCLLTLICGRMPSSRQSIISWVTSSKCYFVFFSTFAAREKYMIAVRFKTSGIRPTAPSVPLK
ncbi:hypothetical protein Tco_0381044 [Tanacetum coccineum]